MSKYSRYGLNLAIYYHSHVLMVTYGSEHSGMRALVTPPGKQPRLAVVLSEDVENPERTVEDGENDTGYSGRDCSYPPNLPFISFPRKGDHLESYGAIFRWDDITI